MAQRLSTDGNIRRTTAGITEKGIKATRHKGNE